MKVTELIVRDHIIIRRGLHIVDAMVKQLEKGQRIEISEAATMLKFLKLFADEYHQMMEENILFPALVRAVPNDSIYQN
jgi:hemerythrin-like domain-containing protein